MNRLQDNKPKCAIYCRVANKNQSEPEFSIEQQKKLLLDYAHKMGYTETTTYLDNGFSGLTLDRPAMKQLNADIAAGKVNTVVVKDLARIARNYTSYNEWLNRMDKHGVTVLFRDTPDLPKISFELQGALPNLQKRKKRKQKRHTVRTPPPLR